MHANPRPHALALALTALALTGCSTVERSRASDYDFASITTFAFKDPPRYATAQEAADQPLLDELTIFVQNAFADRGVTMVPKGEARVVVTATLAITAKTVKLDPNYSQYAMEEIEEGTLTIQVYDRLDRRLIWAGEQTRPLRTKARAFSGLATRWTETGERRQWPLRDMVDRVVGVMPRH